MIEQRMCLVRGSAAPSRTPAPADIIARWDHDPERVEYEPAPRRLAVLQAAGGIVVQDAGPYPGRAGTVIRVAGSVEDGTWLSHATVTALRTAWATPGEYLWTDGLQVWRVRVTGLRAWRDIFLAERGRLCYSYELELLGLAELLAEDPAAVRDVGAL